MTTLGPLAVSVEVGGGLRNVSRHVSGLSYGKTAPGGHGACSFTLGLPATDLRGFGPTSRVLVTDSRSGRTMWDGYAEYPEPVRTEGRDAHAVSALGGKTLLGDESKPRLFVDGPAVTESDGRWKRVRLNTPGARLDFGEAPLDEEDLPDAIVLQFPNGTNVSNGSRTGARYTLSQDAGTEIMLVRLFPAVSSSSGDYQWALTGRSGGSRNDLLAYTFNTTAGLTGGDWANGVAYRANGTTRPFANDLRLELRRASGGATSSNDVWVAFEYMALVTRLMRLDGTYRDAADLWDGTYPLGANHCKITADWVVEDVIGRLDSALFDKVASSVAGASFLIDQLAHPDGATITEVLDSLGLVEPDLFWEVLGRTAAGGHVFNYRGWSDRYVIPRSAGTWTESGADVDLCNRVLVTWQTSNGRPRSLAVTADVPELGSRVRDAEPVGLPDGFGSVENAQRVGEQVLALRNDPPTSGRFSAYDRIFDRVAGRMVEPFEVEPGWNAVLEETGKTLRLSATDYNDDAGQVEMTLGEPSMTVEQRIARLASTIRRKPQLMSQIA